MRRPPALCAFTFLAALLLLSFAFPELYECACVARRLDEDEGADDGAETVAQELPLGAPPVPLALPRCPRVFVYTLRPPFQDANSSLIAGVETTFGFRDKSNAWGSMYRTKMFNLALIWLNRLGKSRHCSTHDHAEADLFLIPFLARGKGWDVWQEGCEQTRNRTQDLLHELPHLNEATAARHVALVSTGFWWLSNCTGWWAHPVAPFTKIARLTNNVGITRSQLAEFPSLLAQGGWDLRHTRDEEAFPRLYTVPYPSSVHITRKGAAAGRPWASHSPRDVLASFTGKPTHGDVPVRQLVGALCHKGVRCTNRSMLEMQKLKQRSVFCLEPMGDTIGRKSLSDDYGCGCIPVFFGAAQAFQYPLLWSGWAKAAYVAIDRLRFLNGSMDLLKTLVALKSSSRVRELQANIARYGGWFQHHFEDALQSEDAMSVTMKHLWADAEAMSTA